MQINAIRSFSSKPVSQLSAASVAPYSCSSLANRKNHSKSQLKGTRAQSFGMNFSGSLKRSGDKLVYWDTEKSNFGEPVNSEDYINSIVMMATVRWENGSRSYGDMHAPVLTGYSLLSAPDTYEKLDKVDDSILEKITQNQTSINMSIHSGLVSPNDVDKFLIEKGRITEAIALKRNGIGLTDDTNINKSGFYNTRDNYNTNQPITVLPKFLIEKGRLHEARQIIDNDKYWELFDDKLKDNTFFREYGINKYGEYNYAFGNITPYDWDAHKEKLEEINIESQIKQSIAKDIAEAQVSRDISPKKRFIADILTFGLFELYRSNKKSNYEEAYLSEVNEQTNLRRKEVNEKAAISAKKNMRELVYWDRVIDKFKILESKKEIVKTELEKGLTLKMIMTLRGECIKVPNCVMMIGENPYMTQEFARWTAETTDSSFIIIPSDLDNDKMQDDLASELDNSKEKWDKTKKRSVIFVEGMEKLLDDKQNSAENIAMMRDLMQKADRAYHATIIFHSENPKKLNPGTITSNRVGLKIKVPITFDDANIYKINRTKKAGA